MITKGSLVAKINKVVSGEGNLSTPVVITQGKKSFDVKSVEAKDGVIVIDIAPAKVVKETAKADTAKADQKETKEKK